MKKHDYRLWQQLLFVAGIATLSMSSHAVTSKAVGESFRLIPSNSCNLTFPSFSSTTTDTCVVDNTGLVNINKIGAGTCTISIRYPASNICKASTVQNTYTLVKGVQVIQFIPPTEAIVGQDIVLSATGGKSTSPVTFESASTAICTVSGANLHFVSAGTCALTAKQAADVNYAEASPVSKSITVQPIVLQEQVITLNIAENSGIVGDVLQVTATGGGSNSPVTLAASPNNICSLQGNSLSLLQEGICQITADQAANSSYLAAETESSTIAVKANKASFSATVLSDKDNSGTLNIVSEVDTVNVSLKLTSAPKDIGKNADLFLMLKWNETWLFLDKDGWKSWNQKLESLSFVKQLTPLTAETVTLPIYSGALPQTGIMEIYAAYRLAGSNKLDQEMQKVLTLAVNPASDDEKANFTCLKNNGIYYDKRCFTDAKDLTGGFSGGLYLFSQDAGLQSSVTLACRLGKRFAVLGRFNAGTDQGKKAEIAVGFKNTETGKIYQSDGTGFSELADLSRLNSKPIGALPANYATAFFDGELPSVGQWEIYVAYRITGGELKYSAVALVASTAVESCENKALVLNTLPLGTGQGEIMTKANADGSVTLSVTATKNQSVFKGWTGDAIGCKGTATTISIIPSVDKFTCQPLFNKQILGTTNCPVDDPTCCNLSNPKCPAIPEDCNPPQDPNTQWLLSIPISNSSAFLRIQITNLSHQNREVVASLYDVNGGEVFVNKTLVEMGNLAPFATVSLTLENLTANGVTWTGRATLKIVNAEGLLAQSFLRPHASLTGLSTSNIGYGTTKHRISYIPTNSVVTPGADTGTIVITNIADIPVKNVSARLFTPDGSLLGVADLSPTELAPKATLRISSDNLGKIFEVKALKGKAFMEIFPQDVTQRCNGKMLIQNFIQQKNIAFSPLINVTPVDW